MQIHKRVLLSAALCALMTGGTAAAATATGGPLNEVRLAQQQFDNDAPWYEGNIPFFDASDPLLTKIYYYRWKIFRAHQRDLGERGYISTEFLDDVGWQLEPWASLNDATGFHILEGRWLRNRRYTNDYINFMYSGGNDRHFSEAIADATLQRVMADGDMDFAAKQLASMKKIYAAWDDHFDKKIGLYWIMPLLDATEYTVSSIAASGAKDGFFGGEAFRPTINSYMIANAKAIAKIAEYTGDKATAKEYRAKAAALDTAMQDKLWDKKLNHYVDRYSKSNEFVKYGDFVKNRELEGYLPWTYDLAPDDATHAADWSYLLSPTGLSSPFGLRTVDPAYAYYMRQYRYDQPTGQPECQWNGPIWPFQTTQALTAMANLLENYKNHGPVTRADFVRLLHQYAELHMKNGKPDLEEDYNPDTGLAIVGLARSHHYFHSGFNDIVISGLAGIRPTTDDKLVVDPLIPAPDSKLSLVRWFALQDVPYHGHLIGVVYDFEGGHYAGFDKGLSVIVDGKTVAHRDTLGRIELPLSRKPAVKVTRKIDLAVQLVRGKVPMGTASVNTDPEAVHDAIDGRVWFFPELPNGWDAPAQETATSDPWYTIDFGKPVTLSSTEISFFADGKRYEAPASFKLEAWKDGMWAPVTTEAHPIANGVTNDSFPAVTTTKLRATFTLVPGKAMRLVEIKAFN